MTLNDRVYCLGISHENNCSYLDHSNINQLSCSTCKSNFVSDNTAANLKLSLCVKLNPVTECKEYDNNLLKVFSTYSCKECTENFYLKDG